MDPHSPGHAPDDLPPVSNLPEGSLELVRQFVSSIPDGVALVAADGRIVLENAALRRLLAPCGASLVGVSVEQFVPESLRAMHRQQRDQWIASPRGGHMRVGEGFRSQRLDGTEFIADISIAPCRIGDERFVVMSIRDVSERASREHELHLSEARFRAVFEAAAAGIAIIGCDGRILSANDELAAILALDADDLVGRVELELLPPPDQEGGLEEAAALLSGVRERVCGKRAYRRPDGGVRNLRTNHALVRDAQGRPEYVIGVYDDVTRHREAERLVRARTLEVLQLLGHASNDANSFEGALHKCIEQVSQSLGWQAAHVFDCRGGGAFASSGIWHLEDDSRLAALRGASTEGSPRLAPRERADLERGEVVWRNLASEGAPTARARLALELGLRSRLFVPVRDEGELVALLEFFSATPMASDCALERAMTQIGEQLGRNLERQRTRDQLVHLAMHDALTGLPNRTLFHDRLEQAFARLDRHEGVAAVFFMDVDGLKEVNDMFGHEAGDELLRLTASRLRAQVRPEDTLARFAGDEFTLLCEGIENATQARVIADRLIDAVTEPVILRGHRFDPSLSVGVAIIDDPQTDPERVLRDADSAMYVAKERGGRSVEMAAAGLQLGHRKLSSRGCALRDAISGGDLVLQYQPCVSLPDERVVAFEALVRWRHPHRGMLPPRAFIPLAEQSGLIEPLGEWVLREACRQVAEWQRTKEGAEHVALQVNVSPRQFASARLIGHVRRALAEARLDPGRLFLEITESAMLRDSDHVLQQLVALRDMGVRISIDDFGSGYSALSHLQRLPLNQLKLDRRFVSGLGESREGREIVGALVRLGHALDLQVVAEGIEKRQDCHHVSLLGCDLAQGWLFGEAGSPAAAVERLIAESRNSPTSRRADRRKRARAA